MEPTIPKTVNHEAFSGPSRGVTTTKKHKPSNLDDKNTSAVQVVAPRQCESREQVTKPELLVSLSSTRWKTIEASSRLKWKAHMSQLVDPEPGEFFQQLLRKLRAPNASRYVRRHSTPR